MGWLSGIRSALGMSPRVDLIERERVVFSPSAMERIAALERGWALQIECHPHVLGWSFRFTEGLALAPLAPGVGQPVIADIATLSRLDGTTLRYEGGWQVEVALEIVEESSANPLSRRFHTNHVLAEGDGQLFMEGDGLPPLPAALLARPEIKTVFIEGSTLSVERVDDVSWTRLASAVGIVLHSWALHGAVVVREEQTQALTVHDRVWQVLRSQVLPGVIRDGGTLELVEIRDGIVRVRLGGTCDGCSAAELTLKAGVERVLLQALPQDVVAVEAVTDDE